MVQFGASERVSRVNWFSSGFRARLRESICVNLIQFGGFRASFARFNWFSSGLQSTFRGVNWFRFGASGRVSRVNWGFRARFASQLVNAGLQSAFRESIGSVRGFRARFASQLGASECVSRVNLFSSGLQSAFRESIGSVRGFRARFRRGELVSSGFRGAFRESIVVQAGFKSAFSRVIGSVRGAFK